ncbi:1,5-anhydro-D-fructose reductase-like [Glandiceps talaboti]
MTNMATPDIELCTGARMPVIGLGTSQLKGEELKKAIKCAIDIGYRCFDCAPAYKNEDVIGDVLKDIVDEGSVKREDLFIIGKLSPTCMRPQNVRRAYYESLKLLKMEYLDLYLIHMPIAIHPDSAWPPPDPNWRDIESEVVEYADTWKAMEELCKEGVCKAIGLSNFSRRQVQRVKDAASIPVAGLQTECHPYFTRVETLAFCKSNNIAFIAHSPLGSPAGRPWVTSERVNILKDATIVEIAGKYNKTPAQVIIRYHVQRGEVAIPKSSNPNRIRENFTVFDFTLSMKDMDDIDALNKDLKYTIGRNSEHPHFPYKSASDYK